MTRASRLIIFCAPWVFALLASCSPSDPPPHYQAEVTTVYKERIAVSHFIFRFWWQERGETPFLREESLSAKEAIFEMMRPLADNPDRVEVVTERVPFDRLASISFDLSESGKIMTVVTRDGSRIQASTEFPKGLKKDPSAGIADGKIYACGTVERNGRATEFQLQTDYIKLIRFTGTSDP